MSILSSIWKSIKGNNTDVETVFGLLISALTSKQRKQLQKDLSAVQQAIFIASLAEPKSTQVQQAKQWIDSAIEIL